MADWVKRLPCTSCLPRLSDPLATCEVAPGKNRCSKCQTDHKKCRQVRDSPELQKILALRGIIHYGGVLGDTDLQTHQAELTTLVKGLHQSIRQDDLNERTSAAGKYTRGVTRNGRITPTTHRLNDGENRKASVLHVRVPTLPRRRIKEYQLVTEDMVEKRGSNGCDQNVPRFGIMQRASQHQNGKGKMDSTCSKTKPTLTSDLEINYQSHTPVDGIEEGPNDEPACERQASYFDGEQHRRQQFGAVQELLDSMAQRSLKEYFARHEPRSETESMVGFADGVSYCSQKHTGNSDDGDCDSELGPHEWVAADEQTGDVEDGLSEAQEDNNKTPTNVKKKEGEFSVKKEVRSQQKAKEAKLKRKLERVERELKQTEKARKLDEQGNDKRIQTTKRKSAGDSVVEKTQPTRKRRRTWHRGAEK